MDVTTVKTPAKPSFVYDQLPANLPAPAHTTPAKYPLGDRDLYLGGGVGATGQSANELPWGVRYAGHNLDAAVSAARELSHQPFQQYPNGGAVSTSIAVFQVKSGYLLTTVWNDDFHSDGLSPVGVESLKDMSTKRDNLVAIVGPDSWLHRPATSA